MTDSERIDALRRGFPPQGFFRDKEWRLSPQPFPLDATVVSTLRALGPALRRFQRACNQLYLDAAEGADHAWIATLLDRGKPPRVTALGRHPLWREDLPRIIRPDLLLTAEGVSIAELDSIPGGIGLTAWLNEAYSRFVPGILGGAQGMLDGFQSAFPDESILISREASDYEPEMRWLAERLDDGRQVLPTWETDPSALAGQSIYRFFELFDLDQVEHSAALLRMACAGECRFTPPVKAYLEEKLWLGLFWEPSLAVSWERLLPLEDIDLLRRCIPRGWIVDPAPLPPFAEYPDLGAASWDEVMAFGRKDRELVLKISGFSELGWGSRGVSVGHDLSQSEWAAALQSALDQAHEHPFVLQRFHHARVLEHPMWDGDAAVSRPVPSRVRLCPYYFGATESDAVTLGGVLATVCPADKKLLHGMQDAMMLPCVLA